MDITTSSSPREPDNSKKPPPPQHPHQQPSVLLDENTTLSSLVSAADDRAAYIEALTRAPDVVSCETPWHRFLQAAAKKETKDDDPKVAAAVTLCRYWKERRDIFGDQRAFRPMNQTGTGALDDTDIEILNQTSLVILPNNCDSQQQGRSTVVIDNSRMGAKYDFPFFFASKLRMCFYVLHVLGENPVSQSVGVAAIGVMGKTPDKELSKRCMSLVQNAFPIRDFEYHVVFLPSRLERLSLVSYIEEILVLTLHLLGFFSNMAVVHRGKTDQEVIKKLVASGFTKRYLPTWIGGSWTLEQYKICQKKRIRMEEERTLTNEEKRARSRQSNAIRSKNKRERRKQELKVLQEQESTLLAQNKKLKETNQYYEQLMVYAQDEIAVLSEIPGSTVAAPVVDQTPNPMILQTSVMDCNCNDCRGSHAL